jgi:hypothetical protein
MRIPGRVLAGVLGLVVAASGGFQTAYGHPVTGAPDCEILPANNVWNQRIDDLPVHARSAAIIRSIGRSEGLHPDFGSGLYQGAPIGIPYVTVPSDQERVPVRFRYADESDPGPYPIPRNAPIEGGPNSDGDRHVLVIDRDACMLYETWDSHPVNGGDSWRAGSGAVFDLNSNDLRPKGWTSADAAGLPILPGLARYEDVVAGEIDHALRFTVERSRNKYVYPARHFASSLTSRNLPAMGQRLRLKAGFDISGFSPQSQIVLRALKQYGMIMADNGSDWYISGSPDDGWDNDDLHELGDVLGRNFEVVDTSSLRP